MFMLLHWFCHRCLGCGKMIKFTLKIFKVFGDVYTCDGTISLCQRHASAQIVVSHNYSTQVSDPFRSSPAWSPNDMIITNICQSVPYLMSLSSPWHCSKTLIGPLGTHFNEISIEIHTFSFKKMHGKMLSVKWRTCYLGLNVMSRHCKKRSGHFFKNIIYLRHYIDIFWGWY